MFSPLILAIVLLIAYIISSVKKPRSFPPGPYWLPIVGNVFQLKKLTKELGGQHVAFSKLSQDYKSNVLGLKLGQNNVVVVLSYRAVKTVLTSEEYDGRPDNLFMRLRSMGTKHGITGTEGRLWKIQRHFVCVHLRQLGFGKTAMENQIQVEASEMLALLEGKSNEEVEIGRVMPKSVLNVLWLLITGLNLERSDEHFVELLDLLDERAIAFDLAGGTLNHLPWLRFLAPEKTGYNLILKVNDKIRAVLMKPIKEHFNTWTEGRCDDLIYSFITEMRKSESEDTTFTEQQLVMICLDIFIAGSHTTSNTLSFAFLAMLTHPNIQEKVRACLADAFEKSEKITYSERQRVPYVEAVLYEVERMYTTTPVIGPRRVLKDTVLEGYHIPKDTTVLMSLYSVHNEKEYWKDPETFRPERFLDEEGQIKCDERLLPFGLGKRRCLGEVLARSCIFTFFSVVMRNYHLKLPCDVEKPPEKHRSGITLLPQRYKAVFTAR